MKSLIILLPAILFVSACSAQQTEQAASSLNAQRQTPMAKNWARFRGPNGSGTTSDTGMPTEWSDTKNIIWKTELAGRGASSPITWGEHIYLTCYTGYGIKAGEGDIKDLTRHLLCFNRDDGKLVWKQAMPSGGNVSPYESMVPLHGYATSTPVADESGVYALFGASGLARFSHDGQRQWLKTIGDINGKYGQGASPILFQNLVIVHELANNDNTVGINKDTGETIWRTKDMGVGWHTPAIFETANGPEMIVNRRTWGMGGANPLTGEFYWTSGSGFSMSAIPVPIYHDGIVYMTGGRTGMSYAFKPGHKGKVSDIKLWSLNKGTEMSTPVYHDGHLYFAGDSNGIAYCVNAKNGELVYQKRLDPMPSRIYGSAVMADGKIYYVSRQRGVYVVAAKPEFEQLAHNEFQSDNSLFNATPAISRGQLLIRSDKFLYCIGEK